jgi:uncharacterized protein YyaL (SSP411 family)
MNKLANAHSPYLKQHAHNPVDWYEWNDESLQKAKSEDKPIIVSIGYSACHWCHVMERESFEDRDVANIMNENFICIKVDREERPDIDAVYMDAIQALGQRGGWPLNAFLTPDTKPFYAGTYFPKPNWISLLKRIKNIFTEKRQEIENSAEELKKAISKSETLKYKLEQTNTLNFEILEEAFENLIDNFDERKGGMEKAPKFVMPCLWEFTLQYAQLSQNKILAQKALEQTQLTLFKVALGGINDQIGGGFARYSVDENWFVPHFEKMLYDNAQLLSLYAKAYQQTNYSFYKNVCENIFNFLIYELKAENNKFYSALDADSEGVEGKFYTFTWQELRDLFTDNQDFALLTEYYNIEKNGNWEHQQNIFHCSLLPEVFAKKHDFTLNEMQTKIKSWQNKILSSRNQRIRPNLDYKIITGWNGLVLKGLCDLYAFCGNNESLEIAQNLSAFIQQVLFDGKKLYRQEKNGKGDLNGYLEDYATVMEGFLALYQITFEKINLDFIEKLLNYTFENFWDEEENLFFFTDKNDTPLIARKKEIFDNVIPASNSIMAKNLYYFGHLTSQEKYIEISLQMTLKVSKMFHNNLEYLANWAQVYALHTTELAQIVIIGENYKIFAQNIHLNFKKPYILLASQKPNNDLPLFENRDLINEKTTIYLCYGKVCMKPVNDWEEII